MKDVLYSTYRFDLYVDGDKTDSEEHWEKLKELEAKIKREISELHGKLLFTPEYVPFRIELRED